LSLQSRASPLVPSFIGLLIQALLRQLYEMLLELGIHVTHSFPLIHKGFPELAIMMTGYWKSKLVYLSLSYLSKLLGASFHH
jgi:hypothetical protein